MGHDRAQATRPAERSAPHAAPAARVVAPVPAAVQLQRRLGNDGAQRWLARAQRAATVSSPHDAAELEAHAVARRVVRTADASIAPVDATAVPGGSIQRAPLAASAPPASSVTLPANVGGGAPLPAPVRSFMEPRFGASFANVRIHTGEQAAQLSTRLDAQAFTVGPHVFFGKDQYRPDSQAGRELIAHELTHTVQQGAAVQHGAVRRSADVTVAERAGPQVQRSFLGIPNPREYFAGKARAIPGFTMLTVVIGVNPITNARVERSAGNILRGAIELIPGGSLITDALNAHGIFDKISAWAAQQFDALKDIGASLWQDIENFLAGFSATDLLDPGGLWDRAKAIVERPIARITAFATALKDGIVAFIKDAILKPIADFARTTRGYPLLCAVMGKDPITGEPVAQDAESLLGAFMKFIGEDEIWANMQKANAIPRAFAWFKGAMAALRGFVNEIPGLFVQALHALQLADIILIPRAFGKLAGVFGGFAERFISWGATAAWNLLEIIFDVVSPGALGYIKKTGAALKSILKNPLPFVGNLVKAAKLGFSNFADHFLEHLKSGLIGWLTGALPGIYIPKAFSLLEIAKFALSVLGLTWANIRAKLVKATSENVVKALETGAEIVIALVRDGPAAAWEKIKEQLSNLKDMVIGGITDFVLDMVVKKAIPKLISMFIPGAGFISAILSIDDTVMVFVNKIKQIIAVVTGFIDSIVAIAGGAIGAAAAKVESSLAGVLSLAINFLAGFAGLGKVADKIMGVFEKLRAPFDKALDWLVNFVVKGATSLIAKVTGKKGDDPQKAGSGEQVKEPFSMGPEGHTVTASLAGGEITVTMASDEDLKLYFTLGSAITEVENDKGREDSQKKRILQTLRGLQKYTDDIRKNYDKTKPFDKYARPLIAHVISELVPLGQYDPPITSLKHVIAMGRPRAIPSGINIRKRLYDGAAPGWSSLSKSLRDAETGRLSPMLYKIWALKSDTSDPGNFAKAEADWRALQMQGKLPVNRAPTLQSYDHAKHFPTFEYQTDHKKSLGTFWNAGQNNQSDSERQTTVLDTGNLEVLTAEANNAKSGVEFNRDVGPKFSSKVAGSPEGSATIDGQPFAKPK